MTVNPASRKKRWQRVAAIVLVVFTLAFWGAWQVDMVRQTVRITWLSWTGGLWKLRGRVERRMMFSAALGEERQVLVYLPPGYDLPANATHRYPVLYLLHGFPDPGDGWARFGLAPQLIDQNIVQNKLPSMLAVLPDAHGKLGKFGDGEYLDAPAGNGQPGTRITSYISRDLPPWVDKKYRTLAHPSARILAGSSTGAYGALNLGLKHPDKWGILIALSGYYEPDLKHFGRVLWGTVPDPARLQAESPLAALASSPHPDWQHSFVYIGNGYKDYPDIQEQSDKLDTALTKAGVSHTHHRLYGHHSWDLWRAMLVDSLGAVAPRLPQTKPRERP